jgi:Flp pilus assembly pilin Flp
VGIGSVYMLLLEVTRRFRIRDEYGASLVEYALLLGLIVVVALVGLMFVGHATANSLNSTGNTLFP